MNRRKAVSIMAGVLALILILALLLSILPASIFAASSSTLKQELEALKDEAAEIKQQRADLKKEQEANASDTLNVVEQKKEIDQQIKLIHDEIDNINAQIQAYNLMIAEKQKELEAEHSRQLELTESSPVSKLLGFISLITSSYNWLPFLLSAIISSNPISESCLLILLSL